MKFKLAGLVGIWRFKAIKSTGFYQVVGLPDANNIAQYQYNHAREHNPDVNLAAQTHGIFYGYQDLSADLS